jgi:hypothetical protein
VAAGGGDDGDSVYADTVAHPPEADPARGQEEREMGRTLVCCRCQTAMPLSAVRVLWAPAVICRDGRACELRQLQAIADGHWTPNARLMWAAGGPA